MVSLHLGFPSSILKFPLPGMVVQPALPKLLTVASNEGQFLLKSVLTTK